MKGRPFLIDISQGRAGYSYMTVQYEVCVQRAVCVLCACVAATGKIQTSDFLKDNLVIWISYNESLRVKVHTRTYYVLM